MQAAPISSTMNSSCELSTEEAGPAFMEENLSQNLPSSGLEILTKFVTYSFYMSCDKVSNSVGLIKPK